MARTILIAVLAIWVVGSQCYSYQKNADNRKPNILFIFSDDLGYNDIGYNNPDVITPNLDKLAKTGMILTNAHTPSVCTPSRHSLLTSTYPWKHGMDHLVLTDGSASCIPFNLKLMPQFFKEDGYQSHLIGKWHLGYCKEECMPTSRGFDTFYGLSTGEVDFYSKMTGVVDRGFLTSDKGYDWFNQTTPDLSADGDYATDLISERAMQLLDDRKSCDPFFMLLSYNAPHVPLQAKKKHFDMYSDKTFSSIPDDDEARKIYLAMITSMDEGIGRIVKKLKQNGLYDNTLIVFSSDNGGAYTVKHNSDNTPYRGSKGSLYEGGGRVVSFVSGPVLHSLRRGTEHDGLFHTMDWMPTLKHFITGEHFEAPDDLDYIVDGVDQYDMIFNRGPSARAEIVHKMDLDPTPFTGQIAIRQGDDKLIWGFPGPFDGIGNGTYTVTSLPTSGTRRKRRHAPYDLSQHDITTAPDGDIVVETDAFWGLDFGVLSPLIISSSVTWDEDTRTITERDTTFTALYNIKDDPSERHPISDPDKIQKMKDRVRELAKDFYKGPPAQYSDRVEAGRPKNNGGLWTTGWCDKTTWELEQEL